MMLPLVVDHAIIFRLKRWDRPEPPTREDLEAALRSEGLEPQHWVDPSGTYHPLHSHPHIEVRWLVQGELRCGLPGLDGELSLRPGDRLEIPARTPHWIRAAGRGNTAYVWAWLDERQNGYVRQGFPAIDGFRSS